MTAFHGTPGTPTPNQMVYASNLPGNQNFELDLGGNMTSGNQQVFGVDNRLRSTASSFLGISPVTATTGSLYIGDSRLIDFDLTTAKITRSYLVEMQGNEPITAIVAGVAEPVWMLGDHAGSTRSLATYGNSQWSIVHLPFSEYGTPLTVIPNTMIATSTIAMLGQIPKFWQGNQYDTDVGLYRINGRVYSPLVGRYIEPVAGGAVAGATNPYQYASGYPKSPKPNDQPGWFREWVSTSFSEFFVEANAAGQWEKGNYGKAALYGGGQLALAGAGTVLGFSWAVGAFGALGGGALATSGAALGAVNTVISNPNASYAEYGVGIVTGAMNPFGEAASTVGGLIGGSIASSRGGSFQQGFTAGNIVGGLLGGGIDDYGRALGKIAKGADAAGVALTGAARTVARLDAGRHALKYTGASVALGSVGAGVGYGIGGESGALMGASLGGALANFAVACFTAGTPLVIDLEGNSRQIEEFKKGDRLLARSEFDPNGPLEIKEVEEVFVRTSPVMELVINGHSIKTTIEHPFYVPAQETFVPAGQLRPGDELISHDGQLIPITSVRSTDQITTVYNLRIAEHHTYFVGGSLWGVDVWVHNNNYVAPKRGVGFVKGTASDAVRNIGRVDHAGEHLLEQGLIAGKTGTKAFREAVRSNAIRILENPLKTFDHVIGGQQVKGFYGMIDGKQVVFFVAKEAKGKIGIGELVTAYMPGPQQIINWGL